MNDKALSAALSQGWELHSYSSSSPHGEPLHHSFLLRRWGQWKVLTVRKKYMGSGVVTTEMEV